MCHTYLLINYFKKNEFDTNLDFKIRKAHGLPPLSEELVGLRVNFNLELEKMTIIKK